MVKKISTVALAAMICLPTMAMAGGGDRVSELEQQMAEMTKMFNTQMQSMKKEIADLKAKDTAISKDVANVKSSGGSTAADWTKKVSLNGQVRFRGYNLQNVWTFDDDKDFDNWSTYRLKGSLKATVKATDDVTAVVQVTDQTYGNGVTTAKTWEEDNKSNKMFLDNAYINVRNMFDMPVDMTFGRQNLMYGSGFVLFDGNSQFASTSIYFDGVKLRWHLTDKMMLDALYMNDEENNRDNASDDDINLSGFYFTSTNCPLVGKSELYVLNRHDENSSKDIWMYGGRASNKMDNGLDYSLEAALQKGDATTNVDQDAWGMKANLGFTFKDAPMAPRLYGGYAYMSGDDPNSNDNEGWDVFYGGWPQFGDLLAWKYVNIGPANSLSGVYDYNNLSSTGGEAPYSNFSIATLGASAKIMPKLSANISYSMLTFDEVAAGADDDFGDYYQGKLKYQYNKQLSFSLYAALIAPGDAFNATAKDDATEAYWEADFRF